MFNQFYALVPSAFDNDVPVQTKQSSGDEAERQRLVQAAQKAGMEAASTKETNMRKCA